MRFSAIAPYLFCRQASPWQGLKVDLWGRFYFFLFIIPLFKLMNAYSFLNGFSACSICYFVKGCYFITHNKNVKQALLSRPKHTYSPLLPAIVYWGSVRRKIERGDSQACI